MQANTIDIVFSGLTAPLRLQDSAAVVPLLPEILPGWPFRQEDTDAAPFFSVTGHEGQALFRCECHVDDRPVRTFDPVNTVCDIVSALAYALPAEDASLICLHAAAVEMAGRLVVFPNIRRAGKSLLSAGLAQAGCRVFSDDVLPVSMSADRLPYGTAMGAAPRLRLPLPDSAGDAFRNWVAASAGPGNAQYQYLRLPDLPAHGTTLPLGAFVILDRQEAPVAASLAATGPDQAMDALLHQNFTRDRHSVDILLAMQATLHACPAYRLTYFDVESAVASLRSAFSAWPEPALPVRPVPGPPFRRADAIAPVTSAPRKDLALRQRPGCQAVTLGPTLYLADPEGRAIHRTDPLAAAIWTLIEEPISTAEVIELVAEEFPEAQRQRIATDLRRLIAKLWTSGLIET